MRPDQEEGSIGLALLTETAPPFWLLREETEEGFTITPDGRHALAARARPGVGSELVDVPLDGSPVTSLAASGANVYKGVDVSRDGRHVVWSTCRGQDELVRLGANGAYEPFERNTPWNDYAVVWNAATDRTVVLSDRSGRSEPWVIEPTGSPRLLTLPLGNLEDVAISDDGKWLAFTGITQPIYVVPLDGSSPPRELPGGAATSATFLHGTHDVAYTVGGPEGRLHVARASAEGGPATPLLPPDCSDAEASPVSEKLVYLAGTDPSQLVPTLFDPRTGRSAALSPRLGAGIYLALRFSPDGKRVFVARRTPELLEVNVASGEILRRLDVQEACTNVAFVRGALVLTRQRWRGNLWMGDDPL